MLCNYPQVLQRFCWIPVLVFSLSSQVASQNTDKRLPVSLDAETTAYDGKSSMVMFQGLRLTQGPLGISADEGFASKMDFENSIWHFNGNVVINIENGKIESNIAEVEFAGFQLKTATILGSPARFQIVRPEVNAPTYAEADKLIYDFVEGIIQFSGQATITEGGNQISSDYLVYNMREQRINASSGTEGSPRVRITYTPGLLSELTYHQTKTPEGEKKQIKTEDDGESD